MTPQAAITLHLSSIDELFSAPATNPFSVREVDILGEAGLDIAQKRILQHWPRLPRGIRLTIQLPPDQITPDLAQGAHVAAQRYLAHMIDDNRLRRQLTIRRSLRQMLGAAAGIAVALAFVALLASAPLAVIPDFLRGVLIVLALYACSVLSFDAVWSLAFDWVPYVQENTVYRVLEASEITIEPALDA
jgi:hypothetical protein